jgi:hypothetical protein
VSEQTCATALITRSNPAKNISPPVYFDLSIHVYYVEKRRKKRVGTLIVILMGIVSMRVDFSMEEKMKITGRGT